MSPRFVLTLACDNHVGLVHAVSGWVVAHRGNITDSQQFDDRLGRRFFMRVEFEAEGVTAESLQGSFVALAQAHGMTWQLVAADAPYRVLVMVSKFGHCLNDLLFRYSTGSLNVEIAGVVSNHRDYERLTATYDIPFHHVPVTADTKADAEQQLLSLVASERVDLVVLARYMQVISDDTCAKLDGRVINIHHSFLPSFKGAKPYHQAHERGVKLIGATAHYVTSDLDEGPIIEQDVIRIDHRTTPEEMVGAGRDVEARVLAQAVRWHTESRLLLDRSRVVVFD
ncbi:formyltetrahydrofolate deformylase [Nocardioides sp.]|uniref:formyltetrahydrofolate deformylase n=1 Tax=Nocardioides sp. TaxID=35761 RepID=UPI002727BCE2|nr:formyltetrahydrofolate deformylase [Nocardioides sp.]MDO9457571.1 formyltetrahydrofolate deformylase [Nocardioides sp.]